MQAPPAPPSVGKRAGALIAAGDLLEPEALSGTPGWGDVPAPLAPGADRRRRAWGREDAGGTGCAAQARTGRQVDEERGLMFLFSGAALASPGVRVSLGLSVILSVTFMGEETSFGFRAVAERWEWAA